jgi:hypothetical protein
MQLINSIHKGTGIRVRWCGPFSARLSFSENAYCLMSFRELMRGFYGMLRRNMSLWFLQNSIRNLHCLV